jgi:hypothetical protein
MPAVAGTGGSSAASEDQASIIPAGLSVSAVEGGNGVLDVIALTLRAGTSATELYAALRNDGDTPACGAGFSVELFDHSGTSLAASITGLLANDLYRFTDGTGTVVSCVGPGDIAMGAILDFPAGLAIDDVASVAYRTPYFALPDMVEHIDAHLSVSGLTPVAASDGTTYTGTVTNGLDFTLSNPAVTVFPVTCAGRPLGAATAMGTVDLPSHGTWSFQTNSVGDAGADAVAYPTGTPASPSP